MVANTTAGANYADTTSGTYDGLSITGNAMTTTYTWPQPTWYYNWPVGYASEARVAELEGEIKVLREMLAALIAGQAPKYGSRKRGSV